jgi:hypothetical protein
MRLMPCLLLAAALGATHALADEPVKTPSKHQLMKECMAKQKASDAGLPKEEMKRNCRDVTETLHENEKTEEKAEEHSANPKS